MRERLGAYGSQKPPTNDHVAQDERPTERPRPLLETTTTHRTIRARPLSFEQGPSAGIEA